MNKQQISHNYYVSHNRIEVCSCGEHVMYFSMVKHKCSKKHINRMIEKAKININNVY